jgi:outer membrane protein TolC
VAVSIVVGASGCAGLNRPAIQHVSRIQSKDQIRAASISEKLTSGVENSPPTATQVSHSDVETELPKPEELPSPQPLPVLDQPGPDRHPIDLTTALQLAGADNLQIALASERIQQARARLEVAEYQWLPSLNFGVGYNYHDGRVQGTEGEVIDTSRNALFVGGGPNVGPGPLTGPGGPPARLFLGLPLADVLFAPLAERQQAQAANAASAATFNDTLLQVALAYLELVQSQTRVAIAQQAETNAEELVRLVKSRVRAGTAPPADGLRSEIELAERKRQKLVAEESVRVASAELVRMLRLDPAVTLFPLEGEPTTVCMIAPETPLPELISEGLTSRPELAQHRALVNATVERMRQEQWRPWLPTVQVGVSAGGFGGGQGSVMENFGGRTDFDALMVWEVRNLGLGNRALQRERVSQHAQAGLAAEQLLDTIASQIVAAYYQVQYRQQQVDAARIQVRAATEAVPLNFKGILGGELRAIEAQQAIQSLAVAQDRYLASVIDHNRAQFQLLRSLGRSPEPTTPAASP